MKDKITEYTDQLIKAATLPLMAEIEALKGDQKEKAKEIEEKNGRIASLDDKLHLWQGIAIGSGTTAVILLIVIIIKYSQ